MSFTPNHRESRIDQEALKLFIQSINGTVRNREQFWTSVVNHFAIQEVVEVGVFRGEFAAHLLEHCPDLQKYHMVDPWKHLDSWNKPANVSDEVFSKIYSEMLENTSFAAGKRCIHKGTSSTVIPSFRDESQEFIYIDGDHTLRGITIDLQNCWPKLRPGGIIGGDDFTTSIWQHDTRYEPSLVFPYTIYFAEAVGATVYALAHNQFLVHKVEAGFRFVDLVGAYGNQQLKDQF